jgi:hypothetical protein
MFAVPTGTPPGSSRHAPPIYPCTGKISFVFAVSFYLEYVAETILQVKIPRYLVRQQKYTKIID